MGFRHDMGSKTRKDSNELNGKEIPLEGNKHDIDENKRDVKVTISHNGDDFPVVQIGVSREVTSDLGKKTGAVPKYSNPIRDTEISPPIEGVTNGLNETALVEEEISNTWEIGNPSPQVSPCLVVFANAANKVPLPGKQSKKNPPSRKINKLYKRQCFKEYWRQSCPPLQLP